MPEQGAAPIEFSAGVLLLLVPVLVLVLSFAPALERRVLARSLAVDIAVRLAVGEPGGTDRATWLARAAATGVARDGVQVGVCGLSSVSLERVERCPDPEMVTVTVVVTVDGIVDSVRHTHRQPVPAYRSRP